MKDADDVHVSLKKPARSLECLAMLHVGRFDRNKCCRLSEEECPDIEEIFSADFLRDTKKRT